MFRAARLAGLYEFDGWSFWVPKAKAIYYFGGLDEGFFTSLPGAAYPPLVPTLDAAAFHAMGSADVVTLHVQYWLFGVGFVWALAGLLAERVRRVDPLAVHAPASARAAARPATADHRGRHVPRHPLRARRGARPLWILDRQRWRLVVATTLLCGMVLTKREGSSSSPCSWPRLSSRRTRLAQRVARARRLGGGRRRDRDPVADLVRAHDIGGEGPTDGFVQGDSARRALAGRTPCARRALGLGYWNVVVPVAVGALVPRRLGQGGQDGGVLRDAPRFSSSLGAIWATWVFSLTGEGYVVGGNFVIRFLGSAALLCVAAAPLLLSAVWDEVGGAKDRRDGRPRRVGLAAAIVAVPLLAYPVPRSPGARRGSRRATSAPDRRRPTLPISRSSTVGSTIHEPRTIFLRS